MPAYPQLSQDTFTSLLTAIKAAPAEQKWTGIPWETDLWQARLKARAAGLPMFIWAMNGNPLGCV